MVQVTMMQTRPITIRMAEALATVSGYRMGQTLRADTRTTKMLVRRGLLELRNDRYCITQLGRETLGQQAGQRLSAPPNLLPISTVKACRYWQSFYGLVVEVQYCDQEDAAWTRLEYPAKLNDNEAIEFITRDFEQRHLTLDRRPVLVKSPDHQ